MDQVETTRSTDPMASLCVRPLEPTDRGALLSGFARLSPASRAARFAAPKPRLTERDLETLLDLDHHDREALVAFEAGSGLGVALARYGGLPDDSDAVELAVTVVDDWQERGVGTALVVRLVERARAAGFHRLHATVLWDNVRAGRMLRSGGFRLSGRDGALLDYDRELEPSGP